METFPARVHQLCALLNSDGIDKVKVTDAILEVILNDLKVEDDLFSARGCM